MSVCTTPEAIGPLEKLSEKLKRRLFNLEDQLFAKRYNLDLGGVVAHEDLVCANIDSLSHATAFHGVWCRNLRELLSEARKLGIAFHNFVDIGSGKGKACFYASIKMNFNCFVGIEFSRPLFEVSLNNARRFGKKNINFFHADACDYRLPPGDSFVFLFNPFDDLILRSFIRNNMEHFKDHRSIVAYANDKQKETLSQLGFETVFRNNSRKISLYQLA